MKKQAERRFGGSSLEDGIPNVANAEKMAAEQRARLSGVRRLQHQRASALCQPGKVERVGGTQAAREAARETAGGSPKGKTSGSERVNATGALAEQRTQGPGSRFAPVATAVSCRVRPAPSEARSPDPKKHLSNPLDGLSFKMLVACNVKCGRGWMLPPVTWPDHRLLLVRAGCGTLLCSAGNIPLRRGKIVFGLPGEIYGLSQDERRRLVVSVLRFELVGGQNCQPLLPIAFRKSLCMEVADFALVEQLVMRLVDSAGKLPCLASGAGDAMLRTILWLLCEAPPKGGPANAGQIAFQELKPALEHRIAEGRREPSIGELSRLCGMSENTFRRRMQACFGLSPTQFLMRRRMERAKQLLLETSHTVEAVSAELGYGETSHFSRQFKAYTSLSPSVFRTSNM